MSDELGIQTPLGRLRVALELDPPAESVAVESIVLASGATLHRWEAPGHYVLLALVVRYDDVARGESGRTLGEAWGVAWTLHATTALAPITVRAELPDDVDGTPNYDEYTAAIEFETPAWVLNIGGPDRDLLSALVESGALPASWRGKMLSYLRATEDDPYGDLMSVHGMRWLLPALERGEFATTYIAVAWGPAGLPCSDTASLNKVSTTPDHLMKCAGIAPRRPSPGGWSALTSVTPGL